jgi:MerR family copper efflux transcriptional regulator
MTRVRIGELGKKANLSPKAIRYYEEIDLLPDPGRTPSGYRDYDEEALERLRFIKAAQAVGFSLGEVREILAFRDRGELPCQHVAGLIERHAQEISERIAALERMRVDLRRLADRARTLSPVAGTFCHIIESAPSSIAR